MLANSTLLGQTAGLHLVVRHVLAGLGHGIHAGHERGEGVEFSEYRPYAPGDDWRRVDWKLMARADRYYVREAERDSHVAVWLWLDASASMAEPSHSVEGLDKLWFARTVLACVAAIAQRQGDAFGLVVCAGEQIRVTQPARGPGQLRRVLALLERQRPEGGAPGEAAVRASLHFSRSPSLVFAVSDFLDHPATQAKALVRLRRMRHDVRALCLQTRAECDASFAQDAYSDPEQPGSAYLLSGDTRSIYRRRRDEHFAALMGQFRASDLPALAITIEEPVGQVLRSWLRQGPRA